MSRGAMMEKFREEREWRGRAMWKRLEHIWELRRDLISDGYDEALKRIGEEVPLVVRNYASGRKCSTWRVPPKWSCGEARLETVSGEVIFSDRDHPLHVVSYSAPFEGVVSREELFRHLHVHPVLENAVPFVFRYYTRDWGLCCTQRQKEELREDHYRVVIRSEFEDGCLKTGEVGAGGGPGTVVLCAHLCHPAMANDDATGVAVAVEAIRFLREVEGLNLRYLLLLLPETMGSLAWLTDPSVDRSELWGGVFLEMLGLDLPLSWQATLEGTTELDVALREAVLEEDAKGWGDRFGRVIGNDERQFNAPGFEIPMVSLSRVLPKGVAGRPYPTYHSHLDRIEDCQVESLEGALAAVLGWVDRLESGVYPVPEFSGEVFFQGTKLGEKLLGNLGQRLNFTEVMYWMNGQHSLDWIADKTGQSIDFVREVAGQLAGEGLVRLESVGEASRRILGKRCNG